MLKVGSLFSGVGGIELGLERTGYFKTEWLCEIDPKAQKVLSRRFPGVPIYKDVTEIDGTAPAVDVLAGGFPCQDVSKAGRRAGLAGSRSGLFFEFTRVATSLKPEWVIVENVPGLLSSNEGKDFRVVVDTLNECGYGVAWRILDSKYFGVAQTRRRVFIVGYLGGPCPAEILFEPEGGAGDHTKSEPEGEGLTAGIERGTTESVVLRMRAGKEGGGKGALIKHEQSLTLATANDQVVYRKVHRAQTNEDYESWSESEIANTLNGFDVGGDRANELVIGEEVRKLTPLEFERLQGFPDNWTCICDIDPCQCKDAPRYKQMGNAVAVPVAQWVGQRIADHEQRLDKLNGV